MKPASPKRHQDPIERAATGEGSVARDPAALAGTRDPPQGLLLGGDFVPSLQGLRTVAMAVVAVQNLYSYGLVPSEWRELVTATEGLYLFVALSGFVLTRRLDRRPLPWRRWFAHRIVGLYSIYLTVVTATVLGRWLLAGERWGLGTVLLTATGLQGLSPAFRYSISGPWWYVALLLQIYLIFPLVYLGVRRFPGGAVAVAAAVSLVCERTGFAPLGMTSFVGPYVVVLVAGAALARVSEKGCSRKTLAIAGVAGALVFAAMVLFWFGWWQWWIRALALGVACVAFFELITLPRLLRWLGGLTAAFFFVHQEPMRLVTRYLPEGDTARLAVWLIVSLALAWALSRISAHIRKGVSRRL